MVTAVLLCTGCHPAEIAPDLRIPELEAKLASAEAELDRLDEDLLACRGQVRQLSDRLVELDDQAVLARIQADEDRRRADVERQAEVARELREAVQDAKRLGERAGGPPKSPRVRPQEVPRGWKALSLVDGGCEANDRGMVHWTWSCTARISNAGDTPAGFWARFMFLDREGNVIDDKLHHFIATAGVEAVYSTQIGVAGPVAERVEQIQVAISPGSP